MCTHHRYTEVWGADPGKMCVHPVCAYVLQLESTDSCRVRLRVPPKSPRAPLSVPYQRMEDLSPTGADAADAQVLRLQMCGHLPHPRAVALS